MHLVQHKDKSMSFVIFSPIPIDVIIIKIVSAIDKIIRRAAK